MLKIPSFCSKKTAFGSAKAAETTKRSRKKAAGFTLPEVLTASAIVGALSFVGVKSYQSQSQRADMSEAKHSLNHIYTAEKQFHREWGAYHENLAIVGALPEGDVQYDVGFKVSASSISATDGNLGSYPDSSAVLPQASCATWDQICQGLCHTALQSAFRSSYFSTYMQYFSSPSCSVDGGTGNTDRKTVQGDSTIVADSSYVASSSAFKAVAVKKRSTADEWSIDEDKAIEHVRDGT